MSNRRKLKMVKQGAETMALLRSMGLNPKAPPRSGRCMLCGVDLTGHKDHSLCDGCFPPDMAELQGVTVDHARIDIADDGSVNFEEITLPADPFVPESRARDSRIVYGATCAWWDSIDKVSKTPGGLPCCPHCGGVLFEMPTEEAWWRSVDTHERNGHPGYRWFITWLRGKCFGGFPEAMAAYERDHQG